MQIRPLGDRVIVKRCEPDKMSKGGIIIPDNAKNPPQEGIVLAVGPGHLLEGGQVDFRAVVERCAKACAPVLGGNPSDAANICCEVGEAAQKAVEDAAQPPKPSYRPLDVRVGDKVIFLKFIGTEIKGPEGEPWVVLHESDLVAVYNHD